MNPYCRYRTTMTAAVHPSSRDSTRAGSDLLLLLVPGLIWGASFLFIAQGSESVGPFGLTFLRILIGFAALACVPGARIPVGWADWKPFVVLGVIWFAVPLTLFPIAEHHVSSAVTGMLNGSNPIFTAIITSLFVRRLPSRGVMIGVAIGVAGTVLMAIPSLANGKSSAGGVALILCAMVCYGAALNVAKPLQARYGALPVIWRGQLVGLLLTAPLGIPEVMRAQWTPTAFWSLMALGALGTGLAHVAMVTAAARLGPTRASAATFLIPVVALVLGVVFRNERVAMLSVIGSAVCLLGAWAMRRAAAYAPVSVAAAGNQT
jgi:drug/metabolite transporter (DMT)-like permease